MHDEIRSRDESRTRKRTMLFLADANPLWDRLHELEALVGKALRATPLRKRVEPDAGRSRVTTASGPGSQPALPVAGSKPYDMLGISRTHFDLWKVGKVDRPTSFEAQVRALRDAVASFGSAKANERLNLLKAGVLASLDDFLLSVKSGSSVQTSGRALGMQSDDVRKCLDQVLDHIHPLFRQPYFATEQSALNEFRSFRGLHKTWLMRGERIVQGVTRFRYVVQLAGGHAIRVKMTIPVIHPTADHVARARALGHVVPHTEYDGWLVWCQAGRLFLTLETRQGDSRADFMFLIVENAADRHGWRKGSYLTVDQDNDRTVVSANVLMQHVPESSVPEADEQARAVFMTQTLRVLERSDPAFKALARRGGLRLT